MSSIVLQDILDAIAGTTTVHGGDLNHTVYLQQIRDAILEVSGLKPGSLHEIIYLQQIRNAILGVPDGQFGSLPASIYLQQIVNAYNSVTAGANGNLDEGIYYDEILGVASPFSLSVTISSTESSPSDAAVIPLTITFSQDVSDFVVGDITVSGFTLSGFTAVSGKVYTVNATPTAYDCTVDVAADVAHNSSGDGNLAASQFSIRCFVKWYLAGGVDPSNVDVAYMARGAASKAASYNNLPNPGVSTITEGATFPAWDAVNGWKMPQTGTTGLLNTNQGIAAVTHTSIIGFTVWTGGPNGNGKAVSSMGDNYTIIPNNGTGSRVYRSGAAGGATATIAGAQTGSHWMAIANDKAYLDGAEDATLTLGAQAAGNTILGNRLTGSRQFYGKVKWYAEYNTTLTPAQLAAVAAAANAAGGIPDVSLANVAWNWFGDPRSVHYNNVTYVGGVDKAGNIMVYSLHHSSKVVTSFNLHAALEVDDHDNPTILIRDSDKKIMAFYSAHNGATMYLRISTNPEDISSWDAEVDLDASIQDASYTYPTPIQLTGEANDPIYLFYRGQFAANKMGLYYSKSTDNGATFGARVNVYKNANLDATPYFKIIQNGDDRIDFTVTNLHPNQGASSVYHFYYEAGNYYQSDGTLIGDSSALPLEPSDLTLVYDGTLVRAWIWDIAIDATGKPVIAYTTFPTPASDHRYNYAHWTGSAWESHEVAQAGGPLYAAETYYSGGMCINHADVNELYLSISNGTQWDMWNYVTADHGANWATTQLTNDTLLQARPFVPRNAHADLPVIWWEGIYTSFTNYATNLNTSG